MLLLCIHATTIIYWKNYSKTLKYWSSDYEYSIIIFIYYFLIYLPSSDDDAKKQKNEEEKVVVVVVASWGSVRIRIIVVSGHVMI